MKSSQILKQRGFYISHTIIKNFPETKTCKSCDEIENVLLKYRKSPSQFIKINSNNSIKNNDAEFQQQIEGAETNWEVEVQICNSHPYVSFVVQANLIRNNFLLGVFSNPCSYTYSIYFRLSQSIFFSHRVC